MTVYIQDNIYDEEFVELKEYLEKNDIKYKLIFKYNIQTIKNASVIFADADIISKMVKTPVSTYPDSLKELYYRNIKKIKFTNCDDYKKPFFIKPVSNKLFNGTVVRTDSDYVNAYSGNDAYIVNVVEFQNEYRLFIADGKVFGSTFILGDRKPLPNKFLKKIEKLNTIPYCAIDVGLLNNKWAVIEVNPPYSLGKYELPIEDYYNYCVKAWTKFNI